MMSPRIQYCCVCVCREYCQPHKQKPHHRVIIARNMFSHPYTHLNRPKSVSNIHMWITQWRRHTRQRIYCVNMRCVEASFVTSNSSELLTFSQNGFREMLRVVRYVVIWTPPHRTPITRTLYAHTHSNKQRGCGARNHNARNITNRVQC